MKISKWEFAISMLCVAFLAFAAGWTLRTVGLTGAVLVEVRGKAMEQSQVIDLDRESPSPTPKPGRSHPVNINTAGPEELMTLPGIGEKRASDIIAEREKNGPYRFPEDLTRVSGIGEETVARLIDYIITEEEP